MKNKCAHKRQGNMCAWKEIVGFIKSIIQDSIVVHISVFVTLGRIMLPGKRKKIILVRTKIESIPKANDSHFSPSNMG